MLLAADVEETGQCSWFTGVEEIEQHCWLTGVEDWTVFLVCRC